MDRAGEEALARAGGPGNENGGVGGRELFQAFDDRPETLTFGNNTVETVDDILGAA